MFVLCIWMWIYAYWWWAGHTDSHPLTSKSEHWNTSNCKTLRELTGRVGAPLIIRMFSEHRPGTRGAVCAHSVVSASNLGAWAMLFNLQHNAGVPVDRHAAAPRQRSACRAEQRKADLQWNEHLKQFIKALLQDDSERMRGCTKERGPLLPTPSPSTPIPPFWA